MQFYAYVSLTENYLYLYCAGVASVLISFIGLMAMADGMLGWGCGLVGLEVVTLDSVPPVCVLLSCNKRRAGLMSSSVCRIAMGLIACCTRRSLYT